MYFPSRHSPLVFVPNEGQGPAVELHRLELGGSPEDRRREEFLQELVHTHPEIIPMKDIEPAVTPLVSICRELETPCCASPSLSGADQSRVLNNAVILQFLEQGFHRCLDYHDCWDGK
jgi:hypothetical protein